MEFNNWKSFISKNILAPLLVIVVLLSEKYLILEEGNLTPMVFGATILGYGILLVFIKTLNNEKYNYLLVYGLIYSLIGSMSIFFFPLYNQYFDLFLYTISILYLIHGFGKMFFRTLQNNFIRVLDVLLGALWIGLVVLSVYSIKMNNEQIKTIVHIVGFAISVFEIILCLIRRVIYYKENAQIIKEMRIVERATPKGKSGSNNIKESNIKKKKKKEGNVEVIDLERFFKE